MRREDRVEENGAASERMRGLSVLILAPVLLRTRFWFLLFRSSLLDSRSYRAGSSLSIGAFASSISK